MQLTAVNGHLSYIFVIGLFSSFTLSRVRRVLEEDLKVEKGGLDAHKQFIRKVLDEVLCF